MNEPSISKIRTRPLCWIAALAVAFCATACSELPSETEPEELAEVLSLTLSSNGATLVEGTKIDLDAAISFGSGLIPEAITPTWISTNSRVATVTSEGLVTARRLGIAKIIAELGNQADTALVEVQILFQSVTAGGEHSCGLSITGVPYCWGEGARGRLGGGDERSVSRPNAVLTDMRFQGLWAGAQSTCGLHANSAYCWGRNGARQLGTGLKYDTWVPVAVNTEEPFFTVVVATHHACALSIAGPAYCWGASWFGQVGTGTTSEYMSPVEVIGELDFRSLDAGWYFTCGITTGGIAYCWGLNELGQLGSPAVEETCIGFTGERLPCTTMPLVVSGDHLFASMAAGSGHVCALTPGGEAYCWGDNRFGQLGIGSREPSAAPVEVQTGIPFTAITAGDRHTCGLNAEGTVYCWGHNGYGALGTSATFEQCGLALCSTTPVPVDGGLSFASVSASRGPESAHTCGVTVTQEAYCWGRNTTGQLGADFQGGISFSPLRVKGQP